MYPSRRHSFNTRRRQQFTTTSIIQPQYSFIIVLTLTFIVLVNFVLLPRYLPSGVNEGSSIDRNNNGVSGYNLRGNAWKNMRIKPTLPNTSPQTEPKQIHIPQFNIPVDLLNSNLSPALPMLNEILANPSR